MPIESVGGAADAVAPAAVVLSGVNRGAFGRFRNELKDLASRHRTYIGGAGADQAEAKTIGATLLSGGPVEEAERLAAAVG
jgi:hypothetical protein